MGRRLMRHIWKTRACFSNEAGVGLVESLIAVAIAAIAITAFMAAISTGSMAVQRSDERVTAENLARSQMEYIKGQDYSSSGSYDTITTPDGYSIAISASTIDSRDISEIQKVTVTVSYNDDAVTVETYKVNR